MEDGDGNDTGRHLGLSAKIIRMALRFAVIAVVVVAANWLVSVSMDLAERLPEAGQGPMQAIVMVTALDVYALLIATPFVPGIEIGLALLLLRGASIAPAVYLATLVGLLTAFFLGRLVPEATLERTFRDFRLRRAADLMARSARMPPHDRQASLLASLPRWLSTPITRYRYLCLAVLLNVPGNAFLGGGGGLMLAAGLSRLFLPGQVILTLALAVLPVPLMIWWFGTDMFGLPPS